MKIGTITFHKACNYGSALQAYALNRYLCMTGHQAEVIQFNTARQDEMYAIFEKANSLMGHARNVYSLIHYKDLKTKKQRFKDFINNRLNLSENEYQDSSQMKGLNSYYDFFICGSDQIWNPLCDDFSMAYLLDFVTNKAKCISYAASIGTEKLPQEFEEKFASAVSSYKSISVREKSAVGYIKGLLEREVYFVPDPVVLLSRNQWLEIIPDRLIKQKYIFCYFIGDVEGMRHFSDDLRKRTGYIPVVVYNNLRDILYINKKEYSAGPEEFLSLLNNCECVCTNSFHAVMFSLIFHKQFWVFTDMGVESSKSRIESILEVVGLENRLLNINKDYPANPMEKIDYSGMDTKLDELRNIGRKFLEKNIGEFV